MAPEPMEEGPTVQHSAEGLNDEAKKFYKMIDDTKQLHKENNSLVFLNVIIYIFLFCFTLYCMLCPKFHLLCLVVDCHFISPT